VYIVVLCVVIVTDGSYPVVDTVGCMVVAAFYIFLVGGLLVILVSVISAWLVWLFPKNKTLARWLDTIDKTL